MVIETRSPEETFRLAVMNDVIHVSPFLSNNSAGGDLPLRQAGRPKKRRHSHEIKRRLLFHTWAGSGIRQMGQKARNQGKKGAFFRYPY